MTHASVAGSFRSNLNYWDEVSERKVKLINLIVNLIVNLHSMVSKRYPRLDEGDSPSKFRV